MCREKNMLRLVWCKTWRRTPLTAKALLLSLFLGMGFWVAMDFWQTRQIETIFHQYLLNEITTQARRDQTLLDNQFHAQDYSVKLLIHITSFVDYVQTQEELWDNDLTLNKQWFPEYPPPWLPKQLAMAGIANVPFILLLDKEYRIRERFYRDKTLPSLPQTWMVPSVLKRITQNGPNSMIEELDKTVYWITHAALENSEGKTQAFLIFISPLNDAFLDIFKTNTNKNDIAVLVNNKTNRVFASSRPDRVTSGMNLSDLKDRYTVVGNRLIDYGFFSNIPIHLATLVPDEDLRHIGEAVSNAERHQRLVAYAILAFIFVAVVFSVASSLNNFTQKMVDISIKELKIEPKTVMAGDQLLVMKEQFNLMTDEILQSRQREESRRTEMQLANDALRQSLIMIKRTQAQLIESEKMASLGGLVAGVAHEINTPVGTGVTAASFLENKSQVCAERFANGTLRKSDLDNFFQDVLESTQMILSNLLRAAELIRSFKQVAVDRTSEKQRSFLLHEYIDHVLLSLRPRIKKTQIKVKIECPETLEINSYPGAFSQIISNLVVNSLVHGFQPDQAGEILLRVRMEGDDILFQYSDNGRGMEEQNRIRIFEPFFTTNRLQGGSGLGMHIVFNLVTQTLKGTIQCLSSPGQGTTLKISIPLETEGTIHSPP